MAQNGWIRLVPMSPKAYAIATLLVPQQVSFDNSAFFGPKKRPEPMRLNVTLAPEQYLDLKKVVVSQKYLVHGRFYGFKPADGPDQPPIAHQRHGRVPAPA